MIPITPIRAAEYRLPETVAPQHRAGRPVTVIDVGKQTHPEPLDAREGKQTGGYGRSFQELGLALPTRFIESDTKAPMDSNEWLIRFQSWYVAGDSSISE
jgi:hypothetical protein